MLRTFLVFLLFLFVPAQDVHAEDFASLHNQAERGKARAQYLIGQMYAEGYGAKQDWKEAYFWYSLIVKPRSNISHRFTNDWVVTREAAQHLTASEKAAVDKRVIEWKPNVPIALRTPLNDAEVAYRREDWGAALRILQPLLSEQNPEIKNEWRRIKMKSILTNHQKQAKDGDMDAQCAMGDAYFYGPPKVDGLGVPFEKMPPDVSIDWPLQNYKKALRWYTKAATEHNFAYCTKNLADMYARGLGIPPDYKEAYFWYGVWYRGSQAADNSKAHAKDIIEATKNLTPPQKAEADKRVNQWLETHPLKGSTH